MPKLAPSLAALAAILFLWWRLLDHLHWEWSINPQYQYGWAVPFLCLYLAWNRSRHNVSTEHPARSPTWIHFSVAAVLSSLWLPTRLVQEANPEWRLVSWCLALEVLGLTLVLVDLVLRPNDSFAQHHFHTANLVFPLGFILLAVPWPSPLEGPLIQALTRATATTTTEALNLTGIPAIQHGNLVEVGRGVIGIEEACCGIRSFQAAFMLALFFGDLYGLRIVLRLCLVLAGLVLALGLNLVRTLLLGAITAKQGLAATDAWHTPLGWLLPLVCFLTLALLAQSAKRKPGGRTFARRSGLRLRRRVRGFMAAVRGFVPGSLPWPSQWISLALLFWLMLTELGTEIWFRAHASKLPAPLAWTIALPGHAAALQQRPPSAKAKQILRFDQGLEATWRDDADHKWHAIFLRWRPGRVAARLAKDHTPYVCLSAAGRNLLAETMSQDVTINGLPLRVHTYVATDDLRGKVHVLYCIREDASVEPTDLTPSSLWQERVLPVLRGRRNTGQRSLELAVWGFDQDEAARAALIDQLRRLVCTPPVAASRQSAANPPQHFQLPDWNRFALSPLRGEGKGEGRP